MMKPRHAPYMHLKASTRYCYTTWTYSVLLWRSLEFLQRSPNRPHGNNNNVILLSPAFVFEGYFQEQSIYKNWLVDALENVIYLNLIVLAILTCYCLNPVKQSTITHIHTMSLHISFSHSHTVPSSFCFALYLASQLSFYPQSFIF